LHDSLPVLIKAVDREGRHAAPRSVSSRGLAERRILT
jgi:hypothetical protein